LREIVAVAAEAILFNLLSLIIYDGQTIGLITKTMAFYMTERHYHSISRKHLRKAQS
jgi:hypothetical protein